MSLMAAVGQWLHYSLAWLQHSNETEMQCNTTGNYTDMKSAFNSEKKIIINPLHSLKQSSDTMQEQCNEEYVF